MTIFEWVWGHFMEHGKHTNSHILKPNDSPTSNNYQYLPSNEWYLEILFSTYTRILAFLILGRSVKTTTAAVRSWFLCCVMYTGQHPVILFPVTSLLSPSCCDWKLVGRGGFKINVLFRTENSVFFAWYVETFFIDSCSLQNKLLWLRLTSA